MKLNRGTKRAMERSLNHPVESRLPFFLYSLVDGSHLRRKHPIRVVLPVICPRLSFHIQKHPSR